MQRSSRLFCVGMLLGLGTAALASAATPECDRACLKSALDQYLNAVIKHDPAAASLFPGFRETENAEVIRPGAGMWQSMTGLGKMQRRYMDPVSEQAGYFGVVEEKSGSAIVTLRVRVLHRQVAEAEWIIARKGDAGPNGPPAPGAGGGFFDPENLAAHPPPDAILPAKERLPREALIAIANSYFDGFTTKDSGVVMSHPGCARIENGTTVTGRPIKDNPDAKTECSTNLANFNVQFVAGRRFPVVDEEAGVVLGIGIFIRKPGVPQRRNVLSEWFTIDHGRIRSIHAAMFYPTAETAVPNWPPYNGNWPLPASLAP